MHTIIDPEEQNSILALFCQLLAMAFMPGLNQHKKKGDADDGKDFY
jgi:hypothetical protein